MKGRKAGGKSEKRLDRKTAKPKQSSGSHAHVRRTSSGIRKVADVQQLIQERDAALDQQAATSEILEVISRSTGDLQPIFAAILQNAVRLCDASFGDIYSWERGALHLLASYNSPPAFAEERWRSERIPPSPDSPTTRILATKSPVHIADLTKDGAYVEKRSQASIAAVELGGVRSFLGMPMLKENELIGILFLNRQFVRPFTDKQIDLVKNFAAEAVIAIENARLLNELRQRTSDLTESLEQQTATSEVLQVIRNSFGDLEPVFATMLQQAVRICDATFGNIYRWDGDALHLVATCNTPPAFAKWRKASPIKPAGPQTVASRLLASHKVVHVTDAAAEPNYIDRSDPGAVAVVELGSVRTVLAVPMRREDKLIGSFTVYRQEVRPFTDKQIELVQNFAAQAVIAVENARLLNELRERTTDLTEALEQQTATSDVLEVISSSPGDLEPVFSTMLENATRICDAKFGNVYLWDGEIGFGIGISHGFATLGTIGFEGRFDYAAIGTVSNVASRLCDEAKLGQILISPRVLMKVENAVTVEPVGEFELKGIRRWLPP
jgi:GAF domain-containing protein